MNHIQYQHELNDKIEQLIARNTELEAQLANKTEALELQLTYNKRNAERVERLDLWLTNSTDELTPSLVRELCEIFDLSETTQHEVTLTISATATLELPRGYDLDSLSSWDFTAELEYSGDGELLEADVNIEDINY